MLFKSIQLHNFMRYRGTSVVNTNVTTQRNVVLINGENDRGKTTLLTAIKFALFGENQNIKSSNLVNYQEASRGDGDMYVEIIFEHNKREYILRRSVKFKQTNIGNKIKTSKPQLKIFENGNNTNLDQEWLEHLLPMDVSQFFIFDGEQIQEFITQSTNSLKGPIEVVLGIKGLLNTQADIKKIIRELEDDLSDEQATHSNNQKKLAKIDENMSVQKAKLRSLNSGINQSMDIERELTMQIDSHKELKDLNERKKNIARKIKNLKEEKENYRKNMTEQRSNLGLFLLRPLLQLTNKSPLPMVKWEMDAAHNILKRQYCVCGRSLDTTSRETLSAKTSKKTYAQYEMHNIISKIMMENDIDSRINEFTTGLQKLEKNYHEIKKEDGILNDIEKKIDAVDDNTSDTDYAIKKLREAQGDIKMWEDDKLRCTSQLERIKKQKEDLVGQIRSDLYSTKSINIKKRLEIAQKLKKAVEKVIRDFYEKRKPMLEKEISNVFADLTNNPQLYHGIEIDDDYIISIKKNDGKFLTTDYSPSAGASQIVATAIISGLSNFATRDVPIVVDTPLGRLDPVHKENVIRYYSQMGKQIIILYQSSEMTDQDIQIISNSIASEWAIESVLEQPGISKVMLERSNL